MKSIWVSIIIKSGEAYASETREEIGRYLLK